MKHFFRYAAMALLLAVAATGCAGLHTLSQAPIANAPNVNLSQDNFHVVKHVQTTFSCVYVFGIGGASRSSMEKNAVADMIIKAGLTGSQTVVNIVTKVSRKMVFFPIYERVEMTVQGTVIEFDGPSATYMLKPDEKEIVRSTDDSIKAEEAEVITVQEETVSADKEIKEIKEIAEQMENTNTLKELRQLAKELNNVYLNCSNKNDKLRNAYSDAQKVFDRRTKEVKRR